MLEGWLAGLNAWPKLSEDGRAFWLIQPAMKFAALIILFGLLIFDGAHPKPIQPAGCCGPSPPTAVKRRGKASAD